MLFNSFEFIYLFVPVTFFVYFFLNKVKRTEVAKCFLVCASLFFYSWWDIRYLPLIACSILFNFVVGRRLAAYSSSQHSAAKRLLWLGIGVNLGSIGYFKYSDFFITNINTVLHSDFALLHLALPLAISFFTFQQVAYLVDSYRGETREYNFLNYALFVTFFPQLIAGPIVHHSEMMPQFADIKNKVKRHKNIATGLFIFSLGLFKKVALADSFALWASAGFDSTKALSFLEAWGCSLSYTFQLYFDFSGYTDMAIGIALLFNIVLPINFNSPYKALDIRDFWRRWHITLSRFLRDYIYFPLGGNRHGEMRAYINVMVTFLVGGLWHGAGWTFVLWGGMHGAALCLHRLWLRTGFTLSKPLAWFITFNFINFSWVFFRARDLSDAGRVLRGMLSFDTIAISSGFASAVNYINPLNTYYLLTGSSVSSLVSILTLEMIVIGFVLVRSANSIALSKTFKDGNRVKISYYALSVLSLGISLLIMSFQTGSEFLYFNF